MPCQGPSEEEYRAMQGYERKMQDPIFAKKEKERREKSAWEWENGGRQKWERERKEEEKRKNEKELDWLNTEMEKGELENIAFNSFMSVFLCKAMEIIFRYDLMKYTYSEMEWWWNEHKKDDGSIHIDDAGRIERVKRLMKIRDYYKVE